jgi:hypothetical protein
VGLSIVGLGERLTGVSFAVCHQWFNFCFLFTTVFFFCLNPGMHSWFSEKLLKSGSFFTVVVVFV